jgi:Nucleotidyltransferase of unknown function (DUF6036)
MSLRPRVDRVRITEFLQRLGTRLRRPARLYLVGGTTMVFEALRPQTLDIDVVLEVSPEVHGELIQAIRTLKDELSINVEEASPGDFIPLPAGYESRHAYIDRFGLLDVLHFDLYSTALSKIERGRVQDVEDVLALLQAGHLEWNKLEACFQDVLPRMGTASLRQDPAEFTYNFHALAQLWRERQQPGEH